MNEGKKKKIAMQNLMPRIGKLIERFRLETGASFESLNEETGLHYNTCRRIITGHPNLQALNMLLLIAELIQRDGPDGHAIDRFFDGLRSLLDDAFDNC